MILRLRNWLLLSTKVRRQVLFPLQLSWMSFTVLWATDFLDLVSLPLPQTQFLEAVNSGLSVHLLGSSATSGVMKLLGSFFPTLEVDIIQRFFSTRISNPSSLVPTTHLLQLSHVTELLPAWAMVYPRTLFGLHLHLLNTQWRLGLRMKEWKLLAETLLGKTQTLRLRHNLQSNSF